MIAGCIGDIIGSVYEGRQWARKDLELIQPLPLNSIFVPDLLKNTKWVRADYSWTDDSLCTLALYHAYINDKSPVESLVYFCKKYGDESIGFGGNFKKWLDNPVPYGSFANGSIMRIGFIPYLNLTLKEKLDLGISYTNISHNHQDSLNAVREFILLTHHLRLKTASNRFLLNEVLNKYTFNKTVEMLHNEAKFEMNALQTFLQACVVVSESSHFEDVLKNCFYVGGDSDTLACVAANIASHVFTVPTELIHLVDTKFKGYPDLNELLKHFKINYED